jgi:hypothetical protein
MNSCGTKGEFSIMRNDAEMCTELSLIGSVLCNRSVTAESQVRFQTSLFGFGIGESGIRSRFSRVLRVSPDTVIPPVLHAHSLVTDTVASNLGTTLFVSSAIRHIIALWLPGNSHTPVTCDLPAMLQMLHGSNPQRESHIRYIIYLQHPGYVARTKYPLSSTPASVK